MTERIIPGRPQLPAPEPQPALPPPEGYVPPDAPDERPWWRRPRVLATIGILAVLLLLGFCTLGGGGGDDKKKGGGQPPATVTAERAQTAEWAEELHGVGTLAAVQGIDVTTELGGTVAAIRFSNGERVRRGETLVLLDTSTERAQLAAQIAQRDQARLAYARALRLIERGAIAQQEVETARANYQTLAAQAEQTRTTIEKKRIDAPFAGDVGIRQVDVGQYVAPGTAIVPLAQIAPIYVNFELPESAFPRVRTGQPVALRVDAFGGRTFAGRINAVNPDIAQATRNFTVQAIVANADRSLRPGMFADVVVKLPGSRRVVAVPATAVTTNAYGATVYRVARPDPRRQQQEAQRRKQAEEEQGGLFARLFGGGSGDSGGSGEGGGSGDSGGSGEGKEGGEGKGGEGQPQSRYVARTTFVQTGERRGNWIEVTKGVRAGTPVVTSGQLKLDDHAPITIARQNALQGADARPDQP